ncbi:MAG: caspase family protein [Myxococcota bacterium]
MWWVLATAAASERAVVVGSSRGGAGQAELRWAAEDAERVRAALLDTGGFLPDEVEVLLDPSVDALTEAIDRAGVALAGSGPGARFLFYYSGHARSRALSLAGDELPLDLLQARLDAIDAQQRLTVFDACQSGEPGTAKGIAPEAAFSFVSTAGLSTRGMAVVASSTAEELSQESDRLQGSAFTVHWVSGLRGAADANHDGVVTLDESYGYAYHHTVAETAATAIGSQHPTLRVERSGHGEWVVADLALAGSSLRLDSSLEAAVTVVDAGSGRVVAEVAKVPPEVVQIAVPSGSYEVIVRSLDDGVTCSAVVGAGQTVTIDLERCAPMHARRAVGKGPAPVWDRWGAVTLRGGGAAYGPFRFASVGGELAIRLRPTWTATLAGEWWSTQRVLPPKVQLETGIYSVRDDIYPVAAGAVWTPRRGRLQPYVGGQLVAVQYHRDARASDWAAGALARVGTDWMITPNFGLNGDLALGAWAGRDWDTIDMAAPEIGLVPRGTLGVVLAR